MSDPVSTHPGDADADADGIGFRYRGDLLCVDGVPLATKLQVETLLNQQVH